ncbi:MAG: SP_1767 family glycosyltransferase [Clostridia bacterium]|nr:SP_1767 family glycosyltransferase [Clostridia bacterium]
MKKLLLALWDFLHKAKKSFADFLWCFFDFFYSKIKKPPIVASVEETIDKLAEGRYSIARFGDGEIKLVAGKDISFQKATPFVVKKLREVLSCDVDGLLVGVADIFGDRSRYSEKANLYWKNHLHRYRKVWYKYLRKNKKYYNASMTRQYISLKDRSRGISIYNRMKKIWNGKDIVFIEGEKSRMGVGNDLFADAKSIKRILAPSTQAFKKYDEVLKEAMKFEKDTLFLIALGPAATALAYDLHLNGYQAVDIGHVDVEYEWLLMNAESKMPIKNKMVFEAQSNSAVEDCEDEEYLSQIVAKIL